MELNVITQKIKEIIASRFELKLSVNDISDRALIFDGGLGLDSLAAIELVIGLEKVFKIVIEDENMRIENFQSIESLSKFIYRKLNP